MDRINQLTTQIISEELQEIQNDIVCLKIDGPIAIIELNNPKKLNALDTETISKLSLILFKLNSSTQIKVVIIQSRIKKAFCAGADIKNFKNKKSLDRLLFSDFDLFRKILLDFKKPLISCVNRIALGGGFELALACDIIITEKNARFGFPEIKLGLFPSLGGTLIVKNLGKALTNEMILIGEPVSSQFLLKNGIINHVCENYDEAKNKALQIAQKISQFPLISLLQAKKSIKVSQFKEFEESIDNERTLFEFLLDREESQEGVNAFIEKRKANFKQFINQKFKFKNNQYGQ